MCATNTMSAKATNANSINNAAGLEGVGAEARPVLDDVTAAVASAQAHQNENTAGYRREGINSKQQ